MVCVHVHGRDVQVYISILMHTFIAQIEFMSQHTNTHTPSHTKHRLLMHESYTVDVNRMTIAFDSPYGAKSLFFPRPTPSIPPSGGPEEVRHTLLW